jgi:hypothetical protein
MSLIEMIVLLSTIVSGAAALIYIVRVILGQLRARRS